jgi:flagellar hook protein FlgE
MMNSINTALTGLMSFTDALQTISSNVANMNTAGFLGSKARFANLFESGRSDSGFQGSRGGGTLSLEPALDLKPGTAQPTGNALDLAISGSGFFVIREADGTFSYTRDGSFHFDAQDKLVTTDGAQVMAMGPQGLTDFDASALQGSAGKATTSVSFSPGSRLSTDENTYSSTITVFDAAGGSHVLTLQFDKSPTADSYTLTVKDGATVVSSTPASIDFDGVGNVTGASSTVTLNYQPPDGVQAQAIAISFAGVTSGASGQTGSNLSGRETVDGQAAGTVQNFAFDASGALTFNYTNGQKATGPILALALLDGANDLQQFSGSRVRASGTIALGVAGATLGSILPQELEGSNVDLSAQFGAIIIDQRGYQACAEVVSTANQMIDSLLRMKSGS